MKNIFWCKSCVVMSTRPRVTFNEKGICSACQWAEEKKKINWNEREKKLDKLLSDQKTNPNFQCIVPVSGGKDSMYQVYMLSQVHKLKVLVVTVMAHLQTPEGVNNLNSLITNLGVDSIIVNPRPSKLKKIR